jgi:hypothetical protein
MALLAIIIIQITASLAALNTGAHFALLTARIIPTLPFKFTRKILDPLAVCLALGCWLGAILLSIFPPQLKWQPRATFALVLRPTARSLDWRSAGKRLHSVWCAGGGDSGILWVYHHGEHVGSGVELSKKKTCLSVWSCERRHRVAEFNSDHGKRWVDDWLWDISVSGCVRA